MIKTAEINERLNDIVNIEFERYNLNSSPLFDYLSEQSFYGFTPKQFELYRDNFIFRTANTIPSIANAIISASNHSDFFALASLGKNLFDEIGYGLPSKSHPYLLEESHRIHSRVVFDLDFLDMRNIGNSQVLLSDVKFLKDTQNKLYRNHCHIISMSTIFAQEKAANSMLLGFYNSLFKPYSNYYAEGNFSSVVGYFSCHISGLEEQHSEDTFNVVSSLCNKEDDLQLIKKTIVDFWSAQSNLWKALYYAMKNKYVAKNVVPIMRS